MIRNVLITLSILFIGTCHSAFPQTARQLENIEAFNRLYGYVRYFHPGDEAADLNWDAFAIYGCKKVASCKNDSELRQTLLELFAPVAPTMTIFKSSTHESFSLAALTPSDTTGFRIVTWQHAGLGTTSSDPYSPYASARTNRKRVAKGGKGFQTITASFDPKDHRNKAFKLTASVKLLQGPGTAHLWARVDRPNKQMGFFDNMTTRPITSGEWNKYEITGVIDGDGVGLAFGCFLKNAGELAVDNLTLSIREGEVWTPVYTNSFESDKLDVAPASIYAGKAAGYKTSVSNEHPRDGEKSVIIQSVDEIFEPKPLFDYTCKTGEYIQKEIGSGLTAIVPLALYGNENYTYPQVNEEVRSALNTQLKNTQTSDVTDLYLRLGDLVITWNIFQHFYPYFDETKTDWNGALRLAIKKAYIDKTETDFLKTLQRFTATLKDGHVRVLVASEVEDFVPPLQWEWIENQLVITKVLNDSLSIKVGDIVTAVDGINAAEYFQLVTQHISAATPGWLHYRAQISALQGAPNSKIVITTIDDEKKKTEVALSRNLRLGEYYNRLRKSGSASLTKIKDSIYYINISKASMDEIRKALPDIRSAKALICDLRGYPNGNHELIAYLLPQNDTSKQWMRVPYITHPDHENVRGYGKMGWEIKTSLPHITAKTFFLIDGSAISYAESYLSFIERYKLATIIGQPSAGTNGNVIRFSLPGTYEISYTGMKVVKHDGSQHHGVGIIPNVFVKKTLRSVKENTDEFLEKAIELASKTK